MTNAVAVVQARMGSQRLPGKMLALLDSRPLVDYALTRLLEISGPDKPLGAVVLATSFAADNDPLVRHVEDAWPDVRIVRGDEQDVLSRFIEVVRSTRADYLVRVTGDCPLINMGAVTQMLAAAVERSADVVNYRPGHEYADKGVEVVSASALQALFRSSELTAHGREHVTSELYRHPDQFRVAYIDSEPQLRRADIRLTVDTEDDLRFFRALAETFPGSLTTASLIDVLAVLDRHPELVAINAGAGRKSNLHESVRVGFRCDGGAALGMGHVVGSVRLARLLADQLGWGAEFVCREATAVRSAIHDGGFSVEQLSEGISVHEDVSRLLAKARESDWSAVVINFGRDDLNRYRYQFSRFRKAGTKLVFMDNPIVPWCYEADLLINALPHPNYPGYEPDSHPRCLDGLAYFIPADRFEPAHRRSRPRLTSGGRVLVAMGGGNVDGLTVRVLEGLAGAGFHGEIDVVVGLSSEKGRHLALVLDELGLHGTVTVNADDMGQRMQRADLGFTGLGLITYEMAYSGLPALIVANSSFNAGVAENYCHHYRTARLVGAWPTVSADDIADAVSDVFGGRVPWEMGCISEGVPGSAIASRLGDLVSTFRSIVDKPLL